MAYLAPIHRASSIRHAIKCRFAHTDRDSLIIAKSNRIEIYDLVPEGLEQVAHFAVYGRVTALLSLRPQQSTLDHLFIGTDRYEYFTVSWDPSTGTIRNERKAHDITDRFQRPAQGGHLYLADPEGRLLGLYLYEGIFTAIPIKRQSKGRGRHTQVQEEEIGNLDDPCPIRMNELRVINMTFLYGTNVPVLAVLYSDSRKMVHLITYEVNVTKRAVKDPEFTEWYIKASSLDHGAKILIPVPGPIGGILIIGEQMVSYFHSERTAPMKKPLHEPTSFVAYGRVDSERYLLSDELGHLYLLLLVIENNILINMRIENLGEACQARAIVYLDNGYVFLGSHFGDSLLVKISSKSPRIETVHSLPNLAPISDFIVLGTEVGGEEIHQYSAGQTMILTCSGGFYDGGLRSVRSGVGIQDVGLLGEMSGVQNIWALKQTALDNGFDDILLFSFAHETRVFSFGADGEVEEVETFQQFSLDTATLAAGNIGADKLVQVTPSKITLTEKTTGRIGDWVPPAGSRIIMASLSDTRLALVLSGRVCLLFDLSGSSIKQVAIRTFENEASCVYIPQKNSDFLVVGFWMPASLALLRIPDLESIREEHLDVSEGSVPRSIMVANMEGNGLSSLFIGMADGEVLTYTITENSSILNDQKRIRLGTQTVTFEALPRKSGDDSACVIATGERPTMIYGEEGRTVYSAITLNQASSVVAFNAEAFPDTVVVATDESVFIAKVDEARTTHTQMSPLHQFARRVAFSKDKKVYSVATIRNSIDTTTGMESSSCYIHIIDENFYDKIDAYELHPNELVESLVCSSLANPDGTFSEKFVVGTAFGNDTDESERGRLLFLELGADKTLRLVAELELPGACHSLSMVKGYILAGLNKSVRRI
ncbi:DNA damage-binding protein 1, variant 2 [Orbilia blumenaviensis]|uniref:DNA damage-binding protein 1, variant 2 n=1 Tax=Orbilia blumenaviensis TaxID=1796055 RepID=A0AAV9VNZ1_9PEZI